MPFFKKIKYQDVEVYLWKYDVSDDFNEKKLIPKQDLIKITNYHPRKKAEYLMVRELKNMKYPNSTILYKKNGAPYLSDQNTFITVTHSYPYAGIAFSNNRVGIDFERVQPKMAKIKHKFLHLNEYKWVENAYECQYLTIIWAIKEALYKLHSSKYWSLKKHYEVDSFSLDDLNQIRCRVFDDEFEDRFIAKVIAIEGYYLAIINDDNTMM